MLVTEMTVSSRQSVSGMRLEVILVIDDGVNEEWASCNLFTMAESEMDLLVSISF